jgi:hypothetical protein
VGIGSFSFMPELGESGSYSLTGRDRSLEAWRPGIDEMEMIIPLFMESSF